jgi:hypothetical protein
MVGSHTLPAELCMSVNCRFYLICPVVAPHLVQRQLQQRRAPVHNLQGLAVRVGGQHICQLLHSRPQVVLIL